MNEFIENTHIVIKREDIYKYLSEPELISLEHILHSISIGRAREGKNQNNTYYICNTDESYADKVLNIILNQGASDGWISCSERLPEENGKYLVCISNPTRCNKNNIFTFWYNEYDKEFEREHDLDYVVAWQPLPAPYHPKGE